MIDTIEQYDLGRIFVPAQSPHLAVWSAGRFAPSTTFTAGMSLGQKTADKLLYPMVPGAGDGTQTFMGFSKYDFVTDANGRCFIGTAVSAVANIRQSGFMTMPYYEHCIANPQDVTTRTPVAGEVDTFTPTTVTAGDVYTITYTGGPGAPTSISFTVTTATAAAVVTGLTAAWKANPILVNLGVPSGTTTFIVTSVNTGTALNLTPSATGTGSIPKTVTTAASGRSFADISATRPTAIVLPNGFWDV